jgi:hypothetical protein
VGPGSEVEVFEVGVFGELPGGLGEAFEVFGQDSVVEVGVVEAAVEGAVVVDGFGGVFGEVAGETLTVVSGDGDDIDLLSPPDRSPTFVWVGGGGSDRRGSQGQGELFATDTGIFLPRWLGVESEEGVEVDCPGLVFDDLDERQPVSLLEVPDGYSGQSGERSVGADDGAPPQFGGTGVEDDGAFPVVAAGTDRRAQVGVAVVMCSPAPIVVRAGVVRLGMAGSAVGVGGVGGPKLGAVRVAKTSGWWLMVSGLPLPPMSPARMWARASDW